MQNHRIRVKCGGSKCRRALTVSDQAAGALEHRTTAIRRYRALIYAMLGAAWVTMTMTLLMAVDEGAIRIEFYVIFYTTLVRTRVNRRVPLLKDHWLKIGGGLLLIPLRELGKVTSARNPSIQQCNRLH